MLNPSSSVASESVRQEVAHLLAEAILKGDLVPNERLNERVLSETLGVSRPPLREAIRQLEAEGLVRSFPRRGSFVRAFTGTEIQELYSLRYAIEAAAAEYVSLKANPETFKALDGLLDDIERDSLEGNPSIIENDLSFHREIVLRSNSPRLLASWDQLARELRLALLFVDPAFYNFAFVENTHKPLLSAIKNKDFLKIREYTSELRRVGDSLKEQWDERLEQDDHKSQDTET